MKTVVEDPDVVCFINWVNEQDPNVQVSHFSWKTCFIGMFHAYMYPEEKDMDFFSWDMPIHAELEKIMVPAISEYGDRQHDLAIRVQCYNSFGELQEYFKNNIEIKG